MWAWFTRVIDRWQYPHFGSWALEQGDEHRYLRFVAKNRVIGYHCQMPHAGDYVDDRENSHIFRLVEVSYCGTNYGQWRGVVRYVGKHQ